MLVAKRGIRRTCDRKKIVKQTRRYSYLFGFIQFIYLAGAATPGLNVWPLAGEPWHEHRGSASNFKITLLSLYKLTFNMITVRILTPGSFFCGAWMTWGDASTPKWGAVSSMIGSPITSEFSAVSFLIHGHDDERGKKIGPGAWAYGHHVDHLRIGYIRWQSPVMCLHWIESSASSA